MSLKPLTLARINTVLIGLVNAGGVRPEDQPTIAQALAELKADEDEYAAKFADLDTRVGALEDGLNGAADALDPPPPPPPAGDAGTTDTGTTGETTSTATQTTTAL